MGEGPQEQRASGGDGLAAAVICGVLLNLLLLLGYLPVARLWQALPSQIGWYLLSGIPALGLFLLVRSGRVRASRRVIWAVVILGLLPRLVFVATRPALSDDIYRYLWDGRVQAAGLNVYEHSPLSWELEELAWEYPDHGLINHPEFQTIYPPGAMLSFRFCVEAGALFPEHSGTPTDMLLFKLLLVLCEGLLLWGLLEFSEESRPLALAYWLCAVPIVELAGSGHLDILAITPMVWALILSRRGQHGWAGLLIAVSISIKLYGLLLLPFLMWPWLPNDLGWYGGRRFVGALLLTLALAFSPFASGLPDMLANLKAFSGKLKFNAGAFEFLHSLGQRGVLASLPPDQQHQSWELGLKWGTRVVAVMSALLAVSLFGYWWRGPKERARELTPWAVYMLMGFGLWWSPQVHPWYWLSVAIWGLMAGRWAWFVCLPLVVLSYVTYINWHRCGVWDESLRLRALMFGAVLVCVALEELQRWRSRRQMRPSLRS